MSMLAELVEVVIGVNTHSQTHTAAVIDARSGGALARATVPADPDGYAELVALADQHSGLPAGRWRRRRLRGRPGPPPR